MKTVERNTSSSSSNQLQMKRQPFFSAEGQHSFFSDSRPDVQLEPFFNHIQEARNETIQDVDSENTLISNNPSIQAKCSQCETEEEVQAKEEEQATSLQETLDIQTKPIFESDTREQNNIQTKRLTVGSPNDKYEREADSVADQVVQRMEGAKPMVTEDELPEVQAKLDTSENQNNQENISDNVDTSRINGITSDPSISPITVSISSIQAKCESCEEEVIEQGEEQEIQRKIGAGVGASGLPTDDEDPDLQLRAMEMEMTEYPILFKKMPSLQLKGSSSSSGSRERIVEEAQKMVGKIEAKKNDGSGRRLGAEHLLEIFHLAAKDEWPDEVIENVKYTKEFPHWCGIFSVYAIKKAGIDLGYWQMGKGVSAFGTLQPTDNPQPGDIGYFTKLQHHCIIKAVNGDMIDSIDGNSGNFSEVKERTRPRSQFHAFFTAFTGSEKYIQRKEETTASSHKNSLGDKLSSKAGKGMPMAGNIKSQMESGFGADFSGVNIHTDSDAISMSKELGAQAFTHGNDIYFNEGKYNTGSTSGKHLLAHELTHTVQQGASVQGKENISKKVISRSEETNGSEWIVANEVHPSSDQLTKKDFIRELHIRVCEEVNHGLQGTPYNAGNCGYLRRVFNRYENYTPQQFQQVIQRYAPATRNLSTASEVIELVARKSRQVAIQWAQTGSLEGLSPEMASLIPANLRRLASIGRLGERVVSTVNNVASTIRSGISSVVNFFFKAKPGGAKPAQNPESVMNSLGTGQSLNSGVRSGIEKAYGTDFSGVQIHTDNHAASLNKEMNSKAFTVGNHVAFGSGEYKPGTLVGDALIAHELAHVQQQKSVTGVQTKSSEAQGRTDYFEKEADQSALQAMSSIYLGDDTLPKTEAKTSGLKLQRCFCSRDPEEMRERGQELIRESIGEHDQVEVSSADRASYEVVIEELRMLFNRKKVLIESGSSNYEEIDYINNQITNGIDVLRQLGVQISDTELMDMLADSDSDLSADTIMNMTGNLNMDILSGSPAGASEGELPLGSRTRFTASLNYMPPGHTAHVVWMFEVGDRTYHIYDRQYWEQGAMQLRSVGAREFDELHRVMNRGLQYELDEVGWLMIDREMTNFGTNQVNIVAYIYLDNQTDYAAQLRKDNIRVAINEPPTNLDIQVMNQRIVDGTHVEARIENYAAPFDRFVLEWSYGQGGRFRMINRDALVIRHPVSGTGERQLKVEAFRTATPGSGVPAGNDPTIPPGFDNRRFRETTAISTGETTITIQAAGTAASEAMEQMLGVVPEERYPSLAGTRDSIESSITELRGRETSDAAHADYYENRREAQENRLERIESLAGDVTQTQKLPLDLSQAQAGIKYTRPIPSGLLVHQTGAFQPLNVYLILEGTEEGNWTARLLDVTGRDVYKFDGSGRSASSAVQNAFSDWNSSENPYPIECTLAHSYSPTGVTVDNNFSTTTAWKVAKKWIDGILMVGGLLVAGFLILVPEPGSTAAGIAMVVAIASAIRGGIAIAENINIGIRATDSRNVLEAVGIVASFAGMGGAALRSAGLQAGRYATYRLGSGLVLSSLAADAGSLAYATYEAMRMISAIQDDPTLGESQKINQILSLMTRLIAQGAIIIATNRDMFTGNGLRRSDFFRSEFRPGETIQIDAGSRLDMIDYMRRNDPDFDLAHINGLPPAQLVGEFRMVQDRTMSRNRLNEILGEGRAQGFSDDEISALNRLNDSELSDLRNRPSDEIRGFAREIIDGEVRIGDAGGVRGRNVYDLADPSDPSQRSILSVFGTPPKGPSVSNIFRLMTASSGSQTIRSRFRTRRAGGHESTLSWTNPNPHYNLGVTVGSTPVDVEVTIRARGFDTRGNPISGSGGGGAHGAETGPATFTLEFVPGTGGAPGKWRAVIEVDPNVRLSSESGSPHRSDDFDAMVGHELDEIADIVRNNHTHTGEMPGTTMDRSVLDQNIAEQQQASMFRADIDPGVTPQITSHDRAAAVELFTHYQQMQATGLSPTARDALERRFNRLLESMGFTDTIDIARFNQLMGALRSSGQNDINFLNRVEAQWMYNVTSRALSGVPTGELLAGGHRILTPNVIIHLIEPRPSANNFVTSGISGGHDTVRFTALNTDGSSPFYVVQEGVITIPGVGTVRRYRQYEIKPGANKSTATAPTAVSGAPTPSTGTGPGALPAATSGTHYNGSEWTVSNLPKSTVDNMSAFLPQAERAFADFFTSHVQGSVTSPTSGAIWFRHTFEGVTYAGYYRYDGANVESLSVTSIFVDAYSIP